MVSILINALAIVLGTIIGLLFRKIIKQTIWDSVLKAIGIVVIVMGLSGIFKSMLYIDNNLIKSKYDLLLLVVITVGTFIGVLLKIDDRIVAFGHYLERKLNKGNFFNGFITAALIFCVGAMSIVGSVNAALGDFSVIYLKSALDGITAIILASTLGFGVAFSIIPLIIYQGLIFGAATIFGNFMSPDFIDAFSLVGYIIVFIIGLNFIREDKIKVANVLPSLLLVILYFLIFK